MEVMGAYCVNGWPDPRLGPLHVLTRVIGWLHFFTLVCLHVRESKARAGLREPSLEGRDGNG